MRLSTTARHGIAIAATCSILAAAGCGGSGGEKAAAPNAPNAPSPAAAAPASPPPPASDAPAPGQPAAAAQQRAQAPPAGPVPPGVDPKKVVATVNGKTISAEKVYSVWQMNKMMLQQRGRTLNASEDQLLKAQSLQVVIADELLYQTAVSMGIKATPADIDAEFKQWRARVGSDENYKGFLQSSGMTEADIRHELERNFQTTKYRKGLAAGKGVSEEQAKQFYAQNPEMFKVPEQAHAQYILVKCTDRDPESVRADAKNRAEDAHKRAVAGEDFSALAKQYSQDGTASKGGDIGFFPRGLMYPKFDEVAFSLKPGEVSPVFQTPTGWNVLKLVELKPPSTRAFDEIKTQLMLEMGQMVEQDVVSNKVQELSKTAKIVVLDPSFQPPPTAAAAGSGGTDPAAVPVRKVPKP
jgi:peptidyl-prolyl cis-trans isomerase C